MFNDNQFQQQFHLLPQEIQDLIYDLTLTASVPEDRVLRVDTAYRPSQLLRVSRASRHKFALSFYGNGTIFRFESRKTLIAWYTSLSQSHQVLVCSLRVNTDARISDDPTVNHRRQNISTAMALVQRSLAWKGVHLPLGTLYVSYRWEEDLKLRWTNNPSQLDLEPPKNIRSARAVRCLVSCDFCTLTGGTRLC